MNPSINDECGLLVDGFERPPVLMMAYNPRYYADFVEAAGYTKSQGSLCLRRSTSRPHRKKRLNPPGVREANRNRPAEDHP